MSSPYEHRAYEYAPFLRPRSPSEEPGVQSTSSRPGQSGVVGELPAQQPGRPGASHCADATYMGLGDLKWRDCFGPLQQRVGGVETALEHLKDVLDDFRQRDLVTSKNIQDLQDKVSIAQAHIASLEDALDGSDGDERADSGEESDSGSEHRMDDDYEEVPYKKRRMVRARRPVQG